MKLATPNITPKTDEGRKLLAETRLRQTFADLRKAGVPWQMIYIEVDEAVDHIRNEEETT